MKGGVTARPRAAVTLVSAVAASHPEAMGLQYHVTYLAKV